MFISEQAFDMKMQLNKGSQIPSTLFSVRVQCKENKNNSFCVNFVMFCPFWSSCDTDKRKRENV